jgi:TRAP-type uncharacterized transport system substrate-binding protein
MCAFKCDSCFHKKVCEQNPAYGTVNSDCALYTNEKNFTDIQQLKAKIAAIANRLVVRHEMNFGIYLPDLINELRQLSAV